MTAPIQKTRDLGNVDNWALPGNKELSKHHATATAAQRHGVKCKAGEEKSGGIPVKDSFRPAGGKLGAILGGVKKHAESRALDPKATQRRPSGYDQVHSRMGNSKAENLQKFTSLKNTKAAGTHFVPSKPMDSNKRQSGSEYISKLKPINPELIKKFNQDTKAYQERLEKILEEHKAHYPAATVVEKKQYGTERMEKLKP